MVIEPATAIPPRGFDELWRSYPWPDKPPFPEAPVVGRHSSGFEILTDAIAARESRTVVMEIGSEFGGSARRFLAVPDTWVVSVDPWPDDYGSRSFPELADYFAREGTMYGLFQTFCWEHRDRLAMVREFSPAGPKLVYDAGVPVDVVYIDGDHRYDAVIRDLTIADALFPDAILCGDDWSMKSNRAKYEGMQLPVRKAVQSWAAFHDVHVETSKNTWMIDKSRPYNLERPPARFVTADALLTDLDRRVKRIERAVLTPSLSQRLERKVRAALKR